MDTPDCNDGTDEASDDQNGDTVNNLSGRHLQAGASSVFKNGKRIGGKSLEHLTLKKTSHHRLNPRLRGKKKLIGFSMICSRQNLYFLLQITALFAIRNLFKCLIRSSMIFSSR